MRYILAAAASLPFILSASVAGAQPAGLDNFDAVVISAEITNQLAKRNLDGAADIASKLMEDSSAEKLKGVFQLVNGLGQSQYTDLVYARDYGRTEKDVIYKIDF